jgi:hypothetical protein
VAQQATPNGTGDFLIEGLHLDANEYKASFKIGMKNTLIPFCSIVVIQSAHVDSSSPVSRNASK